MFRFECRLNWLCPNLFINCIVIYVFIFIITCIIIILIILIIIIILYSLLHFIRMQVKLPGHWHFKFSCLQLINNLRRANNQNRTNALHIFKLDIFIITPHNSHW